MITFIIISFIALVCILSLLLFPDLRQKILSTRLNFLLQSKKLYQQCLQFIGQLNQATTANKLQTHWYLQQWWILIAGFFLILSILIFVITRPVDTIHTEASYLKNVDPQVYALLNGEMLTPPPEVDDQLVDAAIVQAMQIEKGYQNTNAHVTFDSFTTGKTLIDRKWEHMNPRFKQRLLMVFKIMKERYNYELVLLEGYRSPERQSMLSNNMNTTRAKAYQSYHQFGLAADIAFKKDGKVLISERDPWTWQAYQAYGEVAESVGLTWGGRWKNLHDYGHTEYRMPGLQKTAEMAEKLTNEIE